MLGALLQFTGGPVVRKPTAAELRVSAAEYFRDSDAHAARALQARAADNNDEAMAEYGKAIRAICIGKDYELEADQLDRENAS